MVWTPDEKDAKAYVSWTDTKRITLTDDTTAKTFTFSSQATSFTANKTEIAPTPEPTSAMLLLLDSAMLALKRRRAWASGSVA